MKRIHEILRSLFHRHRLIFRYDGANPLVYGDHETCSCGKLICARCGFCSKGCSECGPRQERMRENDEFGLDSVNFPVNFEP